MCVSPRYGLGDAVLLPDLEVVEAGDARSSLDADSLPQLRARDKLGFIWGGCRRHVRHWPSPGVIEHPTICSMGFDLVLIRMRGEVAALLDAIESTINPGTQGASQPLGPRVPAEALRVCLVLATR